MDGYVTKPIEAAEVVAAIRSMVRAVPSPGTLPESQDSAAPISPDNALPVDLNALRRRCMGNRKLAAKALEAFAVAIGTYAADLVQSVKKGDAKSAAATAHKIKGAAGNVSAQQVLRIASQLEALSKSDALGQTEHALTELQTEIERVHQFVATSLREMINA